MHEIIIGLVITVGGSILNFVSTKIYNKLTGNSKNFIWRNKLLTLNRFTAPQSLDELKRRTRIVVIDDEDVAFPTALFRQEGYSIETWKKVEDYGKLEQAYYDIIVLDIEGVAKHISNDDGFGVLEKLKAKNSAQIIISFSQHSYDLNKLKFFQKADENIAKPSDFLSIKHIIDNLIQTQFNPRRYIGALEALLRDNDVNEENIKKLNDKLAKLVKHNNQYPDWPSILEFLEIDREISEKIISLSNTILRLYR